jgi:hypothetical protein
MGERNAGNPHVAFDVEGAGNVARPTYFGLAGSPVLDPTCERLGVKFPGPTRLRFQPHHLDLLFQNTLVRVCYRVLELAGAEYQMLFSEGFSE